MPIIIQSASLMDFNALLVDLNSAEALPLGIWLGIGQEMSRYWRALRKLLYAIGEGSTFISLSEFVRAASITVNVSLLDSSFKFLAWMC